MSAYVEPQRPRHRIEYDAGVEQIRLPARRQIFLMLFLPVWLVGWTTGGVFVINELLRGGDVFLAFWLCGWAVGWVFAVLTLCAQLFGAEILRVTGGDLEVIHRVGPLRRTWRYRGSEIRHLERTRQDNWQFTRREMPLLFRTQIGEVCFDYGSDRATIAAGAKGNDGDAIVDWLTARLPRGASDPHRF